MRERTGLQKSTGTGSKTLAAMERHRGELPRVLRCGTAYWVCGSGCLLLFRNERVLHHANTVNTRKRGGGCVFKGGNREIVHLSQSYTALCLS